MFNNRYGKSIIMRLLGLLLAAGLMMGSAFAEGNNTFFAQFDGMTWSFCSGAGAWSTDLTIQPAGSFGGTITTAIWVLWGPAMKTEPCIYVSFQVISVIM